MASKKLEALRKRLADKKSTGFTKDKATFPFWNLKVGGFSNVRLLPFDDDVSASFWTEKKMIPMEFIDPNDDSKLLRIQAPCMEMYDAGERCPILAPVRQLYKDAKEKEGEGDTTGAKRCKKAAGKHWIKFAAYYQGFVNKAGFTEEEEDIPENPIRVFPFRKQIHKVISESLEDDSIDFDMIPTGEWEPEDIKALMADELDDETAQMVLEHTNGYNFVVRSKKIDEWANYSSSSWDLQKQAPLTDEQLDAIAKYGLHNLRDRLPTKPTEEQIEVYLEMIEVSIGRLLGTDDGYWNPEWEKAGIKPWKPKTGNGDEDGKDSDKDAAPATSARSKAGSKLAERIRNQTADTDTTDDDGDAEPAKKTATLSALKNRRAKAAAEEAPASDAGDDSSADSSGTANSDLAAKIKARLSQG
jgi:hypothetical protein